jgi:hypothetical protein
MADVKRPVNKRNTKSKATEAKPVEETPVVVSPTATSNETTTATTTTVVSTGAATESTSVVSTESTTNTTTTETTESTESTKKSKSVDVPKTYISAARVRRDVDARNLNRVNKERSDELKATISQYKEYEKGLADKTLSEADVIVATKYLSDNKERFEVVEQQLNALSKDKVRFSNTASLIVALLCDEFVRELASFAMRKTVESGKKNVYVSHVHSAGVEKLSYYALVRDLPSFVATAERIRSEFAEEAHTHEIKQLLLQAEKDFKKKYEVKLTKEQKEKDRADKKTALAAAHTEAEEEEAEEDTTSYKYYIKKLFDNNKPTEVQLRISKEIKTYLSRLVDEFLDRLSNQVRLTIINMKNKTVNEVAILHTIKSMMIVGHSPVESLTFNQVDGKYEVVHVRKYPNSGYSELKHSVLDRVEKFKSMYGNNPDVLETATSVQ